MKATWPEYLHKLLSTCAPCLLRCTRYGYSCVPDAAWEWCVCLHFTSRCLSSGRQVCTRFDLWKKQMLVFVASRLFWVYHCIINVCTEYTSFFINLCSRIRLCVPDLPWQYLLVYECFPVTLFVTVRKCTLPTPFIDKIYIDRYMDRQIDREIDRDRYMLYVMFS